jgi:hypothetical protein
VNGVILEGKPVYVSYKKVSKKKVDTKIQPSKEADMPERSKRQGLIQDSAPTGTPSSSEGKTYQEPYYDETGRKARAGSRKPAGYYDDASSASGELLTVMNPPSSFAEVRSLNRVNCPVFQVN